MNFINLYNISMDYKTPLITSIAYVLYSIKTNNTLKGTEPQPRSFFSLLTLIMVIHNIILCMFSLTVFLYTAPLVFNFYKNNSFLYTILDPDKKLQNDLVFWFWVFYISKIYEIIDSLILHWNKRPTSFLQMYHHTGAIICCWMLVCCDTHLPWIFVVLNSLIHTIMYFYYLLTSLKITVPRFLKRMITKMQMVQFVTGTSLLLMHVLIGKRFSNELKMAVFQYVTLFGNIFYVAILFMLFRNFEKETYKKTKKD
ncbi:hypothetical protein GVAV_002313 [Gurleya vavrai]